MRQQNPRTTRNETALRSVRKKPPQPTCSQSTNTTRPFDFTGTLVRAKLASIADVGVFGRVCMCSFHVELYEQAAQDSSFASLSRQDKFERTTVIHGDQDQDCIMHVKVKMHPESGLRPRVEATCFIRSLRALLTPYQLVDLLHIYYIIIHSLLLLCAGAIHGTVDHYWKFVATSSQARQAASTAAYLEGCQVWRVKKPTFFTYMRMYLTDWLCIFAI